MNSRFVIPVLAISIISLILIVGATAMDRLPHYPELNLSPLRMISIDANSSIGDQIQSCSYLLTKSTLPSLADRLSGVDFLTPPISGTAMYELTGSNITPGESLAQKLDPTDIRCSA